MIRTVHKKPDNAGHYLTGAAIGALALEVYDDCCSKPDALGVSVALCSNKVVLAISFYPSFVTLGQFDEFALFQETTDRALTPV